MSTDSRYSPSSSAMRVPPAEVAPGGDEQGRGSGIRAPHHIRRCHGRRKPVREDGAVTDEGSERARISTRCDPGHALINPRPNSLARSSMSARSCSGGTREIDQPPASLIERKRIPSRDARSLDVPAEQLEVGILGDPNHAPGVAGSGVSSPWLAMLHRPWSLPATVHGTLLDTDDRRL